jgi:hypothetical protein
VHPRNSRYLSVNGTLVTRGNTSHPYTSTCKAYLKRQSGPVTLHRGAFG